MKIAVTGGTGFIGRYLVSSLVEKGHEVRALKRDTSDISGLPQEIEWITGGLTEEESVCSLLDGVDHVVHAAVYRPGPGWQGTEGDLIEYLNTNFLGSLRIFNQAAKIGVKKLVYVSTCAVHDKILDDRKLDEAHPLWPRSHYGAHKAAVEKFIHSYGHGMGLPFCAIRPTGVYGVKQDVAQSKWYDLIKGIVQGDKVQCSTGGKEVHVTDVVKGIELLLASDGVSGECYNCYDRYISEYDVALIAARLCESTSIIEGSEIAPKHQIENAKIKALGMTFGGTELLKENVHQIITSLQ